MLSITVFAAGRPSLAAYYVLVPLVASVATAAPSPLARAALLAEKALVLRTIKELEFDRAMGKLAEATSTRCPAGSAPARCA